MPNALAEIGAAFGVAVRLPSLVVAGMAFDLLEGTLPFLDACIACAPLASLSGPSPGSNPVLRLPPELWTIIRTHAIHSALTDSETVFAQTYVLEGIWCTCIKYSRVDMPRRIGDIAKFVEEVGCDCGEQDTVRKDAVHTLMDVSSRDSTTRKLVRYFSLDYEGRIVFNPDRLADRNHRDLETAVLLTVPLKNASTYGMAAPTDSFSASLRTFSFSQWTSDIARSIGPSHKSGKRSKTATLRTLLHSSGDSGIVACVSNVFGT
ncbi:Modular polyketide synthase [Rhodotorula toruloides ATCC 204091]|uniref:Modular polyketide synthase n=1 Tax=Rhodotorula toruloides TaxID=5286 RepID=A0A0K3CHU1_RHOTO|nr:Modular polyketide synthase [Rhodotorula toruloides ATCC 204091]PRQ73207.1 modular polyketide synthase [Rhodotorula toruloides]